MYCERCHYGSSVWKAARCPQCGGTSFTDKMPFPTQKEKAAAKKKAVRQPEPSMTEEIDELTGGSLQGRDYTKIQG